MQPNIPTFIELAAHYTAADEDPPTTARVSLPLESGPDEPLARLVLDYLATLGLCARTLDQLFETVQALDDEDLSAFRTVEGVAVTAASDGWWVLFQEEGET